MIFNDKSLLSDYIIKNQFMIGNELMATPILIQDTFNKTVHLPSSILFFDFHNGNPF